MQKLTISIAVIVHNEAHNIEGLLASIDLLASPVIEEVLIIDNASNDHTRSVVRSCSQQYPSLKLRLIDRSSNHLAEARNLAIQEAISPWIYFTDGDCRLQPTEWKRATTFLSKLSKQVEIAAMGGGNITPVTRTLVSRGLLALRTNWWGHMGSIQVALPEKIQQVQLLSTCNLFLNKFWALKCGGFDKDFAYVGEDLSLCLRLQAAGGVLWAVPGIEVVHEQDRGLFFWFRKMFFYGKAQVDVAVRYPQHFRSLRGLQFLFLWVLLSFAILAPQVAIGFCIIAVTLLLSGFRGSDLSTEARLKGVCFILSSQAFYAVGELSAILLLLPKMLFTLPARIPILENIKKRINPGHNRTGILAE